MIEAAERRGHIKPGLPWLMERLAALVWVWLL